MAILHCVSCCNATPQSVATVAVGMCRSVWVCYSVVGVWVCGCVGGLGGGGGVSVFVCVPAQFICVCVCL